MVSDVADDDIRNLVDGATRFGVIVSAARVPTTRLNDVDFASNMAEAEISARDDGNGVRVVIDAPEVIHLRVRAYSGVQGKS